MQYLTAFFKVFQYFNQSLRIRSPSSNRTPKQPPNVSKILPRSSQEPPKTPSWRRLGRQLRALGALLAALGRSWPLLGRSWDALGTLFDALGRSWPLLGPLRTILARFRDLQGSLLGSPELQYFKRLPINPSARMRTFRKSTGSCPRTVREDSENQVHQRCTASSLLYRLTKKLWAGGLRAAN